MHRALMIAIITMILGGGALTVIKIWYPIIDTPTYVKIITSLGVLTIVSALVLVLIADLGQRKELKDKNYID